ncbi:MAG: cupin domain-containing protein [Pseudomonadota bacterium]
MKPEAGVIPFSHSDRDGTGLEEWETLDPANLASGQPVQRGVIYHEDADRGYMSGIWDCTAFDDRPGPYAVDEFMLLIEGSVVMELPDGTDVTVGAGEAFVLPKGLQCQWKMPGYVRKVFMIVDDPVDESAVNASLTRVSVPDLRGTRSDQNEALIESSDTVFRNAAGTMMVSVVSSAGCRLPSAPAQTNELLHILSGSYSLTEMGETRVFGPGETVYVVQGSPVTREISAGTRFLQACYRSGGD